MKQDPGPEKTTPEVRLKTGGDGAAVSRMAALKVLSGAFLISFSSVYVKLADIGPTTAAFYRVFFGGIVLLVVLAVTRKPIVMSGRRLLVASACGGLFALDLFLWHKSIHYVGPGLATILANFQVFFLALFGILVLGELLTARLVLAIPLAVAGLFLVVGVDTSAFSGNYLLGVFLGIAAALAYTGFILTLRKLQSGKGAKAAISNLALVSLVTAGILAVAVHTGGEGFAIPNARSFLAMAAYGILSQVVGWIIISTALPMVRASLAGLLLLVQPSMAFVWDVLFFNRPSGALVLTGAAVTLLAIYLGSTSRAAPARVSGEPPASDG